MKSEGALVACGEFVGGFDVDPMRPNDCQICERPKSEHGSDSRALARRLGVAADVLAHSPRAVSQRRKDDIVTLLRDAERRILEGR